MRCTGGGLRDAPRLEVVWQLEALDAAVLGNELHAELLAPIVKKAQHAPRAQKHRFRPTPHRLLTPQTSLDEVPQQVAVHLTQGFGLVSLPLKRLDGPAQTPRRAPGARRGSGCRARRTRCFPGSGRCWPWAWAPPAGSSAGRCARCAP